MKKVLIFSLLFFSSTAMMGQKRQVKIGGGLGLIFDGGVLNAWNAELQHERPINTKLSIFTALGLSSADITAQGFYGFTLTDQIPYGSVGGTLQDLWDLCWRFQYTDRLFYLDAGLKRRLFEPVKGNEIKVAVGGSLATYIYNGPENVFVNRGVITSKDDVQRRVEAVMILLGLENQFSITNRLTLSLNVNYRTRFNEKPAFTRRIVFGSAPNTTESYITSSILYSANITLQVGYRF